MLAAVPSRRIGALAATFSNQGMHAVRTGANLSVVSPRRCRNSGKSPGTRTGLPSSDTVLAPTCLSTAGEALDLEGIGYPIDPARLLRDVVAQQNERILAARE